MPCFSLAQNFDETLDSDKLLFEDNTSLIIPTDQNS